MKLSTNDPKPSITVKLTHDEAMNLLRLCGPCCRNSLIEYGIKDKYINGVLDFTEKFWDQSRGLGLSYNVQTMDEE